MRSCWHDADSDLALRGRFTPARGAKCGTFSIWITLSWRRRVITSYEPSLAASPIGPVIKFRTQLITLCVRNIECNFAENHGCCGDAFYTPHLAHSWKIFRNRVGRVRELELQQRSRSVTRQL